MRVRQLRKRLFRITLVMAVGAGLAALAASPERQKTGAREKPAPIIATEALVGADLERCLLPPPPSPDDRPIGDRDGNRNKKKIIVCG
jgi:hypothetical protein